MKENVLVVTVIIATFLVTQIPSDVSAQLAFNAEPLVQRIEATSQQMVSMIETSVTASAHQFMQSLVFWR
ncbi:MAG: hypothetical protein HWD83_02250 [Gammaproteobacteria bacterium]|nr:hypothetical protein [Gammaproteobacteria bacterium]